MADISWEDFKKVDLRSGTIIRVEDFHAARKPAYKIWADFGELGIRKTSAQITALYSKEELLNKQIIGVVNFPPKQIADFISEFLLTGFADAAGKIVMAEPERKIPNGSRLV